VVVHFKRTNPLPLYHQIANVLRSRIDVHEWAPQEQLPSESSLAVSFGVSPLTVRQALALLAEEGRVRREQGRGTFVNDPAEGAERVRLTAPYHELMSSLRDLKIRLVDVQRLRGPSKILQLLGMVAGEEMVRVRRIRLRGKRPMEYAVGYLPPHLANSLSMQDFQKPSVVEVIEAKCDVAFTEADQIIEASLADEDAADVLQIPVGSPLLLVQRNYRLDGGEIGLVVLNRYPSYNFRFEFRLVRRGAGQQAWDMESEPSEIVAHTH
jgi:GntR family transcriptional regulator